MDARSSLIAGVATAVLLVPFVSAVKAYGDDLPCGYEDPTPSGDTIDRDCAFPEMTFAVVWTTHQRIMQAPDSPWPNAEYLPGMVDIADELEDFVTFVSFGRTNMDVRVIRREAAPDSAWVTADSLSGGIADDIAGKIAAGEASASDSTFFKNADGVMYCFGRAIDMTYNPGSSAGYFCYDGAQAYCLVGAISGQSYSLLQSVNGVRSWWRTCTTHEMGHLFGLNHTPQSDRYSPNNTCIGCMGCFNLMDAWARVGCNSPLDFIPYHALHLQRLGWADFVSIERDTTIYVRDFRVRPTIYRIAPDAQRNDFFALYNLQRTGNDSVVAGEGLAITHALDETGNGWNVDDIWDMEIPRPMYTKAANTKCPALPHVANATTGVDTLQCRLDGDEMHLWPFPEDTVSTFSQWTNPWTRLYVTNAVAPYDSQSVKSWLCLTTESLADSFVTGKEMVKVVIDIGCGQESEHPGGNGAPLHGEVTGDLAGEVLHVATIVREGGVDFVLDGRGVGVLERLAVYAPSGRLVRTILLREVFGLKKSNRVFWDGLNSAGGRVASGVYFYRFEQASGEVSASGRTVIVR